MKKYVAFLAVPVLLAVLTGCESVQVPEGGEGKSIYVTRPGDYTILFGSRSIAEYLNINYCNRSRNGADQLVAEAGIQYVGARKWYDFFVSSPALASLRIKADFYDSPQGRTPAAAPLWSTGFQTKAVRLGDVVTYRAVCPDVRARDCRILILSE